MRGWIRYALAAALALTLAFGFMLLGARLAAYGDIASLNDAVEENQEVFDLIFSFMEYLGEEKEKLPEDLRGEKMSNARTIEIDDTTYIVFFSTNKTLAYRYQMRALMPFEQETLEKAKRIIEAVSDILWVPDYLPRTSDVSLSGLEDVNTLAERKDKVYLECWERQVNGQPITLYVQLTCREPFEEQLSLDIIVDSAFRSNYYVDSIYPKVYPPRTPLP